MLISEKIKNIIKPKYPTLNRIEIFSDNLLSNLNYLQSLKKQAEIIPVLKANAYGHGLKEVAKILNKTKLKRIAVDSFPESQIVRDYFKGKILLIGEMSKEAYRYISPKDTEIVVYNLETLKFLASFRKKFKIHLFFNSGMNREGIKDIDQFLKNAEKYLKKLEVVGFCSHLASAESDKELNQKQSDNFFNALDKLKKAGYKPSLVHLGNSASLFTLNDDRLNAYRVGLCFYGHHVFLPNSSNFNLAYKNLKPAMRVVSKVISSYNLKAGEIVSYNATYQITKDNSQIISIPFGYFEGLSWLLANTKLKAKVKTKQGLVDIELVGRVSMNLSSWQIIGDQKVELGDEVIIVSENKEDANSMDKLSKLSQTIIYETLTRFRSNIRRELK